MSNELPPLPHPHMSSGVAHYHSGFTYEQMREYGRACERAAYERAAKLCDDWRFEHDCNNTSMSIYKDGHHDAAQTLAGRIRALGADK